MEENNKIVTAPVEEKNSLLDSPIVKALLKKIKLIIILSIVGMVASFGVAMFLCKPYYVASSTVIFRVNENDEVSNTDKIALAKKLIPSVVYVLKSSIVDIANEKVTDGDYLSAGKISTSYNEDSLLFSLSYQDSSKEKAEKKLKLLFDTAIDDNTLLDYIQANEVSLLETQHKPFFSSGTHRLLFTAVGTLLCVMLICTVIILTNVLDSSIRSKADLEEISGSNLIAYIEDVSKQQELRERNLKAQKK